MEQTIMEVPQRSRLAAGSYHVPHTPGAPINPINILQIGEGNFLRAFIDWMVDFCNGQGSFHAGVRNRCHRDWPNGLTRRMDCSPFCCAGSRMGRTSNHVVSCVRQALNP
jgi:tagaturonate reductase